MASPTFMSKARGKLSAGGALSPFRSGFDWEQISAPRWRDFTVSTPMGPGAATADCWFDDRDASFVGVGGGDDSFCPASPAAITGFESEEQQPSPVPVVSKTRKAIQHYAPPPARALDRPHLTVPSSPQFATSQRRHTRRLQETDQQQMQQQERQKPRQPPKTPSRLALTIPSSPQFATSHRSQMRRMQEQERDQEWPSESDQERERDSKPRQPPKTPSRLALTIPSSPQFATSHRSQMRRMQGLERETGEERAAPGSVRKQRQIPKTPNRLTLTMPASPVFATAHRAQMWQAQEQKTPARSQPAAGKSKSAYKPVASKSRIQMMTLTQPSTPQFHTAERAVVRERFHREHREEIDYPNAMMPKTPAARVRTMTAAPAPRTVRKALHLTLPASPQFFTTQRAAMRQQHDLKRAQDQVRETAEERWPSGALRSDHNKSCSNGNSNGSSTAARKQAQKQALTLPQSPNFRTTERAAISRRQRAMGADEDENRIVLAKAPRATAKRAAPQRQELTLPASPQFQTTQRAAMRKSMLPAEPVAPASSCLGSNVTSRSEFASAAGRVPSRPTKRQALTTPQSPHFQTTDRATIKRQRSLAY